MREKVEAIVKEAIESWGPVSKAEHYTSRILALLGDGEPVAWICTADAGGFTCNEANYHEESDRCRECGTVTTPEMPQLFLAPHRDSEAKEARCPYAKSDMTPCARKDGEMAVALTSTGKRICVGCELPAAAILQEQSMSEQRVVRGFMTPKDEEFPDPATVVLPRPMGEAVQPVTILTHRETGVGPLEGWMRDYLTTGDHTDPDAIPKGLKFDGIGLHFPNGKSLNHLRVKLYIANAIAEILGEDYE